MERRCEVCGKAYESKSPKARFCSSTCRSRAHRGGQSQQRAASGPGGLVALPQPPAAGGELIRSVEKELQEADRLETYLGQAAVDLARRIEFSTSAPLSQAAAAHRELRAAVADAVRGAHVAKSAMQRHRDELAARREKRRA